MEARAVRKHIRGSAIKMRTVANLVRGKRVPEALSILQFMPHRATRPIELTIRSAYANLVDQNKDERINEDDLVVREIRVDEGPMFKRYQSAPRGRALPILKRTSHVTVVVGSNAEAEDAA